ncbi:trypsin-like peptidase domain-containing protein [Patescibacteria group bacterium]|nr:trypsin-like peptidase domain-containing protein [Patescibacteria group bacterium]
MAFNEPTPIRQKKTLFQVKNPLQRLTKKLGHHELISLLILVVAISSFSGFAAGAVVGGVLYKQVSMLLSEVGFESPESIIQERVIEKEYIPQTTQEQKIINVVKNVSPAVVSIVITKDVPIIEQFFVDPFEGFFGGRSQFRIPQFRQQGTEKREVGGGSGFIVSTDGLIITNKHVVLDDEAEYTVFTTDGSSFSARVLAKDPFQDLAVLKIDRESIIDSDGNLTTIPFVVVVLGDSNTLKIGQTVITIGNALAKFQNTVSVGVISGLGRTITASGSGNFVETIENVIQTDAAINRGNSGGPLLNLVGEVIGINTATVLDAQNIGFAIPVNRAERDIKQVMEFGKIVYPFLGIRYILVTEALAKEENLSVTHGVWVNSGPNGEDAVISGSAAEAAGIVEGDILLEMNGERIDEENSLATIIQKYDSGDIVVLKVLHEGQERIFNVQLGEYSE